MPFEFRPRGYLHFDAPVRREVAIQIATDPAVVAAHAFYPFILATVTTQKIRKKAGGGVEKKAPKHRPIAYAAHKDAHLYSHYGATLETYYEAALRERGLYHVVTAFRRLGKRSNIHFANEAFEFIRARSCHYALASDITDFFGQLDHRLLKCAWTRLLGLHALPADHYVVYKAITRYCFVDRDKLHEALGIDPDDPRKDGRRRLCIPSQYRALVRGGGLCQPNMGGRGIPQGSPISAVLANLYMMEFDTAINAFVAAHGGLYRRYCDDLLVLLPTAELRDQARSLIVQHLESLRLEAHRDKTEQIDFVQHGHVWRTNTPLNYLGFTFDGQHKRIRSASIARYYKKMRLGVGRAKAIRYRVNKRDENRPWTPLKRRQLHLRYSYLGRHNFTSYAFRAARIMNDPGIKRQIKPHWRKLQRLIKGV